MEFRQEQAMPSCPSWLDFMAGADVASLLISFPSGTVNMSPKLLAELCLTQDACPGDLWQWYELFHPEDHNRTQEFNKKLFQAQGLTQLSLSRRLYCGDGVYRVFNLEACVARDKDGKPRFLMGIETLVQEREPEPVLVSERENHEHDYEREQELARELAALEDENLILRRHLQRQTLRAATSAGENDILVLDALDAINANTGSSVDGNDGSFDSASASLALAEQVRLALQEIANNNFASVLSSRVDQLNSLLNSLRQTELTVGIVGLTSSGKSTFINAMMGERLLPEETRATTNLTVLCRKGGVRAADIFYLDGRIERVSGAELTPHWMEEHTSEHWNPGNNRGIERIEWSSPGASIPTGLVLADTPGLDACDMARHGDLVLRQLLPSLDIVLYITSIRASFKIADLELMNAILENNQRLILILSQIDIERDDTEAGQVILSREQKLERAILELRESMVRAALPVSISNCPIIPVSSKLALEMFYNRESDGWRASNFDLIIQQLVLFRENIARYGTVLRARRALALLERVTRDLTAASLSSTRGQEALTRRIRELRDAHRWISAELSSIRNEWSHELESESYLASLKADFMGAISGALGSKTALQDALHACCLRQEAKWDELVLRMTTRMDRARESCRQTFEQYMSGLKDTSSSLKDLPGTDRSIRRQEIELRAQVNLDSLSGQFKFNEHTPDVFIQEAVKLMGERLSLLRDHLNWWENHMRELYCDPLYRELTREESAKSDVQSMSTHEIDRNSSLEYEHDNTRSRLASLRIKLRANMAAIRQVIQAIPSGAASGTLDKAMQVVQMIPSMPGGINTSVNSAEPGFFDSLVQSMREQAFLTRFLALTTIKNNRRFVLLGLRRHDSMRLLSRLAHDAMFAESGSGSDGGLSWANEQDWLHAGSHTPDSDLELEIMSLPPCVDMPELELPEGFEFLVAPSDSFCEGNNYLTPNWDRLFERWVPIVHLDIARIDSGLSDLTRSPYIMALSHAPCWILAFGHGGLFDNRLADLALDVPERLKAFTSQHNFTGHIDWFIYENYDPRYTDFLALGQMVKFDSTDAELTDSTALWTSQVADEEPPFTRENIQIALMRVRDRLRQELSKIKI